MEIYLIAGAIGLIALALIAVVMMTTSRRASANFEAHALGDGQRADRVAGERGRWGETTRRLDEVAASAIVPGSVAIESAFRILIVLARARQIRQLAERRAHETENSFTRPQKLGEKVRRGSILNVVLTGPSLQSAQIVQLRWDGRALEASFQLKLDAGFQGTKALFDASIFLDKLCLGVIPLSIAVTADKTGAATSTSQMVPPKSIFVSYSSMDRDLALIVARAYRRVGIDTFIDCLSIEGGQFWKERLAHEVDRCDAVYLLWSQASADSKYVRWEIKRAMDRRLADPARRPLIITHIVGPPPPVPPPEELSALQFNDPALALWEQSIKRARDGEAGSSVGA